MSVKLGIPNWFNVKHQLGKARLDETYLLKLLYLLSALFKTFAAPATIKSLKLRHTHSLILSSFKSLLRSNNVPFNTLFHFSQFASSVWHLRLACPTRVGTLSRSASRPGPEQRARLADRREAARPRRGQGKVRSHDLKTELKS